MKPLLIIFLSLSVCLICIRSEAIPSWDEWLGELKVEAVSQGIDPLLFDQIFENIPAPDRHVQHFQHRQPEHRITYTEYRDTRADNFKILIGRKEYKKHKIILENIGRAYDIEPCYIVALWGMETSYGRFMGKFPVIQSLATLAYDSSRKKSFRTELIYALHMLNQGQVSLEQFRGEWAGATGQPQFLPSSWFEYAVDYDLCGRKDIWTSYPDVFASIANYLKKNNWNNDEPLVIPVVLPTDFDSALVDKTIVKSVRTWNALGVRTMKGDLLPYQNLQASIIQPEGGPTLLAFPNFKVLLKYNNSIYYAATIGYMADAICQSAN